MAEVDGEDAGETIDVGLTEDVGDPDPFTALQNQRVLAKGLHLREVDHQLRRVDDGLLDHCSCPSHAARQATASGAIAPPICADNVCAAASISGTQVPSRSRVKAAVRPGEADGEERTPIDAADGHGQTPHPR